MRREDGLVDAAMMPYYQDVYDHVLRAADSIDALRDLVSTILETHLTIQGNQMNQVMKQVTSWAAIAAVPTIITGYYGMNVRIFPGADSLSAASSPWCSWSSWSRCCTPRSGGGTGCNRDSAVVLVLQRDPEVALSQHRDDGLQVVALLARHPHRVALDGGLHALRAVGLDQP